MASAVSVEGQDDVPEYESSEQSSPYASVAVGVAGSDAASACELRGGWEPLGRAAPEVGSALPDAVGVCAVASAVSVEDQDDVPEYGMSEQSSPYASEAVGVAGSDAASACELKGGWEPLGKAAPEVGSALPDADGV